MVLLLAWLMFDNLISALRVFGVSAGYSRKAVRRTVHVKSLCGAVSLVIGRDQSLSLCRHSGSCWFFVNIWECAYLRMPSKWRRIDSLWGSKSDFGYIPYSKIFLVANWMIVAARWHIVKWQKYSNTIFIQEVYESELAVNERVRLLLEGYSGYMPLS